MLLQGLSAAGVFLAKSCSPKPHLALRADGREGGETEIWDYVLVCVEENQRREGRHGRGERGDELEGREWDPPLLHSPKRKRRECHSLLRMAKHGSVCTNSFLKVLDKRDLCRFLSSKLKYPLY